MGISKGKTLVIATKNRGKIREFNRALAGLGLEFLSLHDFPHLGPIEEDGTTFLENACKKALVAARHSGLPALADDSGLEVDYLGGAPGVLSARFAGRDGDDEANNRKLLELLAGVPCRERQARFRCALAVATPEELLVTTEGVLEGYIGLEPRGKGGFGYDPLFVVPDYNCTLAEMALETKNKISHRGRALEQLREKLVGLFVTLGWDECESE
ncbi:MAG: XTP/dITP diphosphatase [bacterium]|mgnify:CR=1 FL=1|jgi:XTP/dITP diphosphohydrolase|nr:XTP/dITP diphosphatase [Bacillota bacterium]